MINLTVFIIIKILHILLLCSRQAGHRLCNHIDRAMFLLRRYSKEDDDELREFCLQACEAFVIRCPDAIRAHVPKVSRCSITSVKETNINPF